MTQPDQAVPALIVKIGRYPWHHGGVGAIRSLGRVGVPVYAITEDRWTPAAVSRYLSGRFVWPTTGLEEPAWLVERLIDIGRRIGIRSVLVPFDDEAAVLIAEHAADLRDSFLFPMVEGSLPRRLASKRGLRELCLEHGVPTPGAAFPVNRDELARFAERGKFPVVAKNMGAFERKRAPVVSDSTRIDDAEELRAIGQTWGEDFSVILQDYLPREDSEDWILHAYCDESTNCTVEFTGVKVRSFPPQAGMTTRAYSVHNPVLKDIGARFVKNIGYHGALDMDWRFDRRSGEYNLLDFNPRVGAQFRLFENAAGIDVVRAMHLDLTGRSVPLTDQVDGRRYIVEHFDLAAALTERGGCSTPPPAAKQKSTELAWLAVDDLRPSLVTLGRFVAPAALSRLRQWFRAR